MILYVNIDNVHGTLSKSMEIHGTSPRLEMRTLEGYSVDTVPLPLNGCSDLTFQTIGQRSEEERKNIV